MRVILSAFVILIGLHIGYNAYATVNECQEQRAEQLCTVDPSLCGQN